MANILYISSAGVTESLGESQVVQYLLDLSKNNSIHLFSFEKSIDKKKYPKMQDQLTQANINWLYFEYSNRFGILSTASQMLRAFFMLGKVVKKQHIQIIHARSLIPAVIGAILKKIFKVKLIFDIRGFAIDEKIVDGRLKAQSLLTKLLKKIESMTYKTADHIVTLTHVSKPIINSKYLVADNHITVIPTCANLDLFKQLPDQEKKQLKTAEGYSSNDFIILHNGSLNGWVDFDAQLKLFEQLAALNPNIKFLFLNKGQHALIHSNLEKYNIDKRKCKILAIEFSQVNRYLNIADLCVFFIKPSFAKQASAPTKFAELVSCNLYSITNTHYGDMEYYFNSFPVGTLLDLNEVHNNPHQSALKVMEFIEKNKNNKNSAIFNDLFTQHFSKQLAVKKYQNIYNLLIEPKKTHSSSHSLLSR